MNNPALINVLRQLRDAEKPVIMLLKKSDKQKIIAVGLRTGVMLDKHLTHVATRLLVLKGEVTYHDEQQHLNLGYLDQFDIPVDQMHWVDTPSEGLFVLIQEQ